MLYYIWLKCGRANKPEAMGGQRWLWQTSPRGILDQLLLKRSAGSTTKSSQVLKTYFFHQVISGDIFFFRIMDNIVIFYRVCELECLDCWSGKSALVHLAGLVKTGQQRLFVQKSSLVLLWQYVMIYYCQVGHIAGRWPSEANSIHSGSGDGPGRILIFWSLECSIWTWMPQLPQRHNWFKIKLNTAAWSAGLWLGLDNGIIIHLIFWLCNLRKDISLTS